MDSAKHSTAQAPRRAKPLRAVLVHGLRVALVAALLWAIPSPGGTALRDGSQPPPLEAVQQIVPDAASVGSSQDVHAMWPIQDADGETIGRAARTLPAAEDVVGYRGPTETLVVFGPELTVQGVRILTSADTAEHVEAIQEAPAFLDQFVGWPWGGPETAAEVDAVSGATLTSLAVAEGLLKRIGGDRPSLVFGEPLELEDAKPAFPEAASLQGDPIATVRDSSGTALGLLIRSGGLTDDITGYQGPSELVIAVAPEGKIADVQLRHSYDNQPYVDYVRQGYSFWPIFEEQTFRELAAFDPEEAGVEGVSGATMTSLAVADTAVAAAREARQKMRNRTAKPPGIWQRLGEIRWTWADTGTFAALLLVAAFSWTGWYRSRPFRRLWLLGVIGVIGLWAGNLVSLALVAGWSAEGIAWRLAPGLTAIATVALLAPPTRKANPYCNHLCPHGAIQQLIRPGKNDHRRLKLPARWMRRLSVIPGVTLVAAYLALIAMPTLDLSSWEPFHAYLFRIAGWGAFALAIVSLAVAAVIPMGYCRLGCPTGRLLDYLRRTATSERIGWADAVAISLLAVALSAAWWRGYP